MKTRLTVEQSQHLMDLGVPKGKASISEDMYGPTLFSLEDFLNGEILPKEINSNGRNYYFAMECMPLGTYSLKYVTLDGKYYLMGNFFQSTELINALYKLACWYYGEYLKSEKR